MFRKRLILDVAIEPSGSRDVSIFVCEDGKTVATTLCPDTEVGDELARVFERMAERLHLEWGNSSVVAWPLDPDL